MKGLLDFPADLAPLAEFLVRQLRAVEHVFDDQLVSDLPPLDALCRHVENYRGKMLRPTLVVLSGLATHPRAGIDIPESIITREHHLLGAVAEMVHMATLVHDDVLDDAEYRRRGLTVNKLRGNEAAVILGDYLIASSYELCSQLPTPWAARLVGKASMTLCAGELLQLHHRKDYSLDEPTYFEIIDRKTAELIAAAAELGARQSGATEEHVQAMITYGRTLGLAFQIQDDLLDLQGNLATVGKSVARDLAKSKLTLPLIHHLGVADAPTRQRTLDLLRRLEESDASDGDPDMKSVEAVRLQVLSTNSVEHAKSVALSLVEKASKALTVLPQSQAKSMLLVMADAVVTRNA